MSWKVLKVFKKTSVSDFPISSRLTVTITILQNLHNFGSQPLFESLHYSPGRYCNNGQRLISGKWGRQLKSAKKAYSWSLGRHMTDTKKWTFSSDNNCFLKNYWNHMNSCLLKIQVLFIFKVFSSLANWLLFRVMVFLIKS